MLGIFNTREIERLVDLEHLFHITVDQLFGGIVHVSPLVVETM